MGERKSVEQQIAARQAELARLTTKLRADNRRADAHKKILLGGLVIAASAGELDPAELAGVLSAYVRTRNADNAAQFREAGVALLAWRKRRGI